MTIKEIKTQLSASLNMLHGFCYKGKLCKGWREINENVIEFMFADGKTFARVRVNEISEIGTFKLYDELNGFRVPYANVTTD